MRCGCLPYIRKQHEEGWEEAREVFLVLLDPESHLYHNPTLPSPSVLEEHVCRLAVLLPSMLNRSGKA